MKRSTATLVWIDAKQANVCRWDDQVVCFETFTSTVPAHRRSTGHVRHAPEVRHGGGGSPQDAGEPRRREHLRGFLADVARRVAPDDRLEVIGPGSIHERLVALVTADDCDRGRVRHIRSARAAPLTRGQMRARLQKLAGVTVRRTGLGTG